VARVKGLSDWGVLLELIVWMADPADEGRLRSDLYRDLLKALPAAGISLAYPRRDVHLFPTAETQE
jgi:small-conductance mechanosensitive channel